MENNTCIRLYADPVKINKCKEKLKAAQRPFYQLSNILVLAGNEVRLKIIYLLEEEKELCPCDLADILGMTMAAVSQHLRKLKDGGIITSKKEAQTIYYSLAEENLNILKPFFKHIKQQTQQLQSL